MKRIKTKLTRFHVGRLHDALQNLLRRNLKADPEEAIGRIDVMRVNGNTYVSLTDMNGNIVITCIEEGVEDAEG